MATPPRIMIVDDENVVVLDLKGRLAKLGYVVCASAASAGEAVRKATATRPDLVLMDIRLKGDEDGIQAAEQIRGIIDVPVVFLTAYADENTLQRAKITGPFGYLLKPFEERELQITIEIALYRHMTDRKLRESEQWLSTTLRSIGEAVITTDAAGLITYMNPLAETLTSQASAAVLGRPVAEFVRLVKHDTQEVVECPVASALRDGSPTGWANHRLVTGQPGAYTPIDANASPIRDAAGNVIGVVLSFRDVSERVRADAERRELAEQFHHAQKMEAVGRLTGGIAHEFNNLLTVMNGYAEILRNQMPEGTPAHHMISQIHRSGWQAADLIRYLLAFSRRQTLNPRVLRINDVIEGMQGTWARLIGEDITVETNLAADLGYVEADPAQVELALINLVVNARDAMPEGGVLRIATANARAADAQPDGCRSDAAGECVSLTVSDTGTGMSEDVQAHIFEPFFTTKEPGRGTGLGLAAVHGFLMQSGGTIRCDSRVGVGTTFTIQFPRVAHRTPMAEAGKRNLPLPTGRETILLVEDEPAVRRLAREVLAGQGYNVLAAEDGQQALQIAAAHAGDIALLVTDMAMPGMSGTMLARQMLKKRPPLKILFMSGHPLRHAGEGNGTGSSAPFLPKPFTCRDLARTVREVLDRPMTADVDSLSIVRS